MKYFAFRLACLAITLAGVLVGMLGLSLAGWILLVALTNTIQH